MYIISLTYTMYGCISLGMHTEDPNLLHTGVLLLVNIITYYTHVY